MFLFGILMNSFVLRAAMQIDWWIVHIVVTYLGPWSSMSKIHFLDFFSKVVPLKKHVLGNEQVVNELITYLLSLRQIVSMALYYLLN